MHFTFERPGMQAALVGVTRFVKNHFFEIHEDDKKVVDHIVKNDL
jgi:hypothetical protein